MNIYDFYLSAFLIIIFIFFFGWGHVTFEALKSERSFFNYFLFICFLVSFSLFFYMFFLTVFGKYVLMVHAVVNFISYKDATDDFKQLAFLSFFVSPLIIVGCIIFNAKIRYELIKDVKAIFGYVSKIIDCFFGIFRNLYEILTSVLALLLGSIFLYFALALAFFILALPVTVPMITVYRDYKYNPLSEQIILVLLFVLIEILVLYFIGEFGRFIEKIEYHLNGGINSGDAKPISLYRTYKRKLNALFSKSNDIDWVNKLRKLFQIFGEFIILLIPNTLCTLYNLVIFPYTLARYIARFVMRSVRSL